MWNHMIQGIFGSPVKLLLVCAVLVVLVVVITVWLYYRHRKALIWLQGIAGGLLVILNLLAVFRKCGWISFGPEMGGIPIWLLLLALVSCLLAIWTSWKEYKEYRENETK